MADRLMQAVRITAPGLDGLELAEVERPLTGPAEALVEVHAAAITPNELEWPVDRLPAIPSYELSGVVVAMEQTSTPTWSASANYSRGRLRCCDLEAVGGAHGTA
jgi:NADPH:quinone reductase-like Zn-dependent oxidoreductase